MSATVDWVTLTSADLLVSLRVPRGWEASAGAADSFVVRGEPDATGPAPTFAVRGGRPEEPGHDWFDTFAAGVAGRLTAEVPDLELIDTDRYRLSSRRADVHVVRARSGPGETGTPTTQVRAWVWGDSHTMLVLAGSTPRAHERRDLPIFDAIIGSLRLLPPRPHAG